MIEFIKTIFNVGDTIYLVQNGVEVGGKILSLNDAFIAIETEDGNIIGVKDEAVASFSKNPIKSSAVMTSRENKPLAVTSGNPSSASQEVTSAEPSVSPSENKPTFKQYKPGDKIPLESLKKRDPSLADSWKRSERDRKRSRLFREKMQETYEEVLQSGEDLDMEVPPIGAIVDLKPSYQFGFIDDVETGERFFFNKGDIVDPLLKDMIGEGIRVVYQRSSNHKGRAAKCIHLPQPIVKVLDIVMSLVNDDDYIRSKALLETILKSYPDSAGTQKMLEELKALMSANGADPAGQVDNIYIQARKALERRDYDMALKLYGECLNKGVRKTNSIKEMAQVYISLHSQEKDEAQKELYRSQGLAFIESHKEELPDNASTRFSLENIYFALGDYEKHIDVVEDIISESSNNGDLAQVVFYLNKAAQSYLRINDLDRALDAANQGLEVEPDNTHLLKTMASIKEAIEMQDYGNAEEDNEEEEKQKGRSGGLFGFFTR